VVAPVVIKPVATRNEAAGDVAELPQVPVEIRGPGAELQQASAAA